LPCNLKVRRGGIWRKMVCESGTRVVRLETRIVVQVGQRYITCGGAAVGHFQERQKRFLRLKKQIFRISKRGDKDQIVG
jgi:hypothetical protein